MPKKAAGGEQNALVGLDGDLVALGVLGDDAEDLVGKRVDDQALGRGLVQDVGAAGVDDLLGGAVGALAAVAAVKAVGVEPAGHGEAGVHHVADLLAADIAARPVVHALDVVREHGTGAGAGGTAAPELVALLEHNGAHALGDCLTGSGGTGRTVTDDDDVGLIVPGLGQRGGDVVGHGGTGRGDRGGAGRQRGTLHKRTPAQIAHRSPLSFVDRTYSNRPPGRSP